MKEEFVPYELALKLKQLGFDEPCFLYWWKNESGYILADIIYDEVRTLDFKAPLFQQAFRWFREKYGVHASPRKYDENYWWVEWGSWTSSVFETFEEAELACLDKLIEIVELNQQEQ
jgi:hypothetical protein